MKHTTKIVIDTRKALLTGKYPVKIRVGFPVYKNGKIKFIYQYYGTGVEMFEEEFNRLDSRAHREVKSELVDMLNKANSLLDKNTYITPEQFGVLFANKGNYNTVQGLFEIMRAQARAHGRVSTYGLYGNTSNSLTKFVKHTAKKEGYESTGELPIGRITPEFLQEYEHFLVEEEKLSYNTVGIYTRNIRTLFNLAISKKIIKEDLYPFGRNQYVTPAATARKLALTEAQKNKLLDYKPEDEKLDMALDFWTLSFFCFGLNFSDICRMRRGAIGEDNIIRLHRIKTFRTKRVKKQLEIPITDRVMEIIKKRGNVSLDPNSYVFNIISDEMDAFQQKSHINDFIKDTNEALKVISEKLGLPKITTYTARHTFAYIMKIKNIPVSMVQEMMDHQDQKTTVNYQGSFEINEKVAAVKLLYG